jgi:hypothetical protein
MPHRGSSPILPDGVRHCLRRTLFCWLPLFLLVGEPLALLPFSPSFSESENQGKRESGEEGKAETVLAVSGHRHRGRCAFPRAREHSVDPLLSGPCHRPHSAGRSPADEPSSPTFLLRIPLRC